MGAMSDNQASTSPGSPAFEPGDIFKKNKVGNSLVYFISDIEERGGYLKYRYSLYAGKPFRHHQGSGWRRTEYFDARVAGRGDENEVVEHNVRSIKYVGKVGAKGGLLTHGNCSYEYDSERARAFRERGSRAIEESDMFHQTKRNERCIAVQEVGCESEGLADDMIRLSHRAEEGTFVEHESHVVEAIDRGLWVPIKLVGKNNTSRNRKEKDLI